ncbi:hypothetical protein B566_EDAN010979 [Ephemera danica]|nr:hypothetical protein B566_EDAN010979 [Ephemera danica]
MALENHLSSQSLQSKNLNSSSIMFSTLKAIRQAASTGVSAAGISSCIEKVLTLAPRVHSLDRITSEYRRASCILSGLNAQVMAACDAALTLGGTREASLSLLDVVSQHWVTSSQELKQDGGRHKGFPVFMLNLMDLYRSLLKFNLEDLDDGLASFITTWENPLSISLTREYSCVWSGLREALEKFVEESDKSNCKCQVTSVRKIIKSCRESFSYYESRGVVSTAENFQTTYLQNLLWYLQTLSSLVTKCSHEIEGSGDCNPFVVLTEGWSELLGRLVFELDAPLSHVERVTTRLQLDLLCAVVAACCPSVQLSQLAAPAVSTQLPAETAWAKISLNAGSAKHSESNTMSANLLASTLLSHLVSALVACSNSPILSQEDFTHASQNIAVLNVLNDTSKLINVDLESLTSNLERVSFLCNITNLLFLHGLVVLGPHWGLVSSHHVERKSAFHCVGYHVGQMGFVSISGLLSQLVGPEEQILAMHESREQYWTIGDKRAYFCLTQGTTQSPVLQVIDHEKADIQLSSVITRFINRSVRVEGSTSEGCFALLIPRMVLVFLGISSPSSLEHAQEARDEPTALQQTMFPQVTYLARDCTSHIPQVLEFLQHYATDQLQFQLAEWAEAWKSSDPDSTDLIVTVEEASMKFGVVLPLTTEIINSESMQSSLVSFENSSLAISWETRTLSPSVRKYLEHQCWLVALLATRLRQDATDFHVSPQTACLDRLSMNHMSALAVLAGGNVTMAALQPWQILSQSLWTVLDKFLFEQHDIECSKLILSLPEASMASDVKLQTFRDVVLYQVASQGPAQSIDKPWRLALCLGTAELRAKCVLNSIKYWPGPESLDILKTMLGETTLTPSTRTQIVDMLHRVTIYQNVHQVLCYYQTTKPSSWYEVCKLSEENPGQVLQSLIKAKQYRLCLPWAELHGIPHRAQHLVNASFVSLLLEIESSDFSSAEKLLSSIPIPQAVAICRRLLGSLTLLPSLRFVVSFALEKCQTWLQENPTLWARLQLWSVGLSILALLPISEQCRDRTLASQPHLLLEQLLMNSRLAILEAALKILRDAHLSALPADSPTQPIAVDTMLRQYATKALDFRVSNRAVLPEAPCATQDELLQSLTTGSTGSGHVPFVMPAIAPTKLQWIPNDEVTECMCCSSVSFSMFNRRHHCRRCGRVVCGTCSVRRAKVDGYGDLPVRICDDCHEHMNKQRVEGEQPSTLLFEFCSSHSSQNTIEWRLLGDEAHDRTVREEFAFEHAPSVGLCLSILDLHSEHAAGEPRVLIEAADQMLKLLKPPKDGCINPELDYVLVIRMARSLLMAAKVRYAKMALNSGVAHCDRLLGQVDLLSLLVRSGCGSLLPKNGIPFNDFDLRHLRDSLVAAEMWSLALEVSTKVGLERGGVWAAWGKACLRAGRWMEAREHLAYCLQTSLSAHDPSPAPLLKEVINILEETSYKPESPVMKQTQHLQSPALTVLHTLASLTETSQGKFPTLPAVNNKTLFNSECQYYLSTYGSHAANLLFFISRSDLMSALCYVREKNVESEIFAEALYKPCLRQGLIGQLHEEMRNVDSTLEVWKVTLLHVGRLLEHQGLLQSLYQLQLYAHDLVRAAMTCIRFYHASARCYTELSPEYLHKARSHLENELTMTQWKPGVRERDEQSPPKSPIDSMESSSSGPPEAQLPLRLPARQLNQHVSTICRQLEVTKFLQQCEIEGRSVVAVAAELRKEMQSGSVPLIPTLFGSSTVRAFVSALLLVCGKNVEEDAKKIQAHLACGQLKSAYLLAVKLGRSGDVQGVLQEAEKANQPAMVRICKQWLLQQQKKVS